MSVQNPERLATKQDLADMYQSILPYLGGMPEMVANKFSKGDLYSTEEKMIGQWIDGKPLYQKVVNLGNLPNTTAKSVAHNISNAETIFIKDGFAKTATDDFNTLPYLRLDDSKWGIEVTTNLTNVIIKTYADRSAWIGCVILQYTKTTDSAISIGSDTDYSTEEKIVGTWITGEPIYQKTIETPFTNINAGERKYISIIPNISQIGIDVINAFGFIKLTRGSKHFIPQYLTETFAGVTDNNSAYMTMIIGNNFSLLIKQNFVNEAISGNAYVTIQYTKTT